ncbi:muts domain V-domain-containing protein [Pilobolus umbonatus]|nr:muts domain V-domain-containing protein [Pilobolus umbonatus]
MKDKKATQRSILSFFQSKSDTSSQKKQNDTKGTKEAVSHTVNKEKSLTPLEDRHDPMELEVEDTTITSLGRKIPSKRPNYKESDSEEEVVIPKTSREKRRKRVQIVDDESEDDYQPPQHEMKEEDDYVMEYGEGDFEEMDEEVKDKPRKEAVTPMMERFKSCSVSSPLTKPSVSALSRLNALNSSTREDKKEDRKQKFKVKNDDRYSWLLHQKDADGNPIESPHYNPRTLYIPKEQWNKFTPFEKQYWEVKSKLWDTVVFFKKGKFYELYEKDADIGHSQFDLKMTDRVNMRMVGVPEMSFDYWAAQFIAKGFKVAKVDQMETAIGKSMREKKDSSLTKADKIIRRELTSVLTAGTLVDSGLLTNDMSTYCMSIKEECMNDQSPPRYGISFVDTATAEFNLLTFEDDLNRTKLETLIMQIKPREVVTEKGRLSKTATRLLKNLLNDPLWNMLNPGSEFWDAAITDDEITVADYFEEDKTMGEHESAYLKVLEIARKSPLLMSSFGGLIYYLRSLKLDTELLSAKNIKIYDPIRNGTSLVLDGQTLANLEIFQNSHDGSTEGTVFKLLQNSISPFGKRLFKRWLCHPLRNISEINARLDAIEDLMKNSDINASIAKQLSSMPDLERLISRIHSGRIGVKEFLATLQGFQAARNIIHLLDENRDRFKSSILRHLMDDFPNFDPKLDHINELFVVAEVDVDYQKVNTLIPQSGMNEEWDSLHAQMTSIEKAFDDHLMVVKKQLKTTSVNYKDIGKDIYQLEIPKNIKVPDSWIKISSTAKLNRYWDATVKSLVTQLKELLETKNAFVKKFAKIVYAEFDESYSTWLLAVQYIAELDALMGLAKGSKNMGEPSCRPVFLNDARSVIEFEELRHPCVVPGVSTDFIPNDIGLGGKDPNIIVLTGPNMGGKSTLLRQTCVAIIIAQLGGYVPARSCRLTPCDQIFTRIGANDNIMGGKSTFMVELSETSRILHEATPHSMVILDELGRGTSTHDGYSIAYSVLHHLCTHVGCLAMFATHYQTLCKEFERNPEINNMHMGYLMEEEGHNVTFLYKLTSGICEKSFGVNVASMAGVLPSIVKRAAEIAEQAESSIKLKDSTYTKGGSNITPAVIADLAYILSSKPKSGSAVDRIIKGLMKLEM